MKVSVTVVVLMSLVVCSAFLETAEAFSYHPPTASPPLQSPPGVPSFCAPKCVHRCSRNPRDLCKKLCMMCCGKCKCVPTGPFGDKGACPCYRDILNSRGKPKCP
uniref:Gibberellin regulated protein n=1 Tax=Opuntia streptacantha TaxID=393608 RepID=A0A7C8Z7D5_OPUST